MSVPGPIIGTSASARQFPSSEVGPRSPAAAGLAELSAVALLAALGGVLRFQGLAAQSLWADEGNSWGMAVRPLSAIAAAAAGDIHPPLYYYLLNLWSRLFGTSEAGLRSLSALLGLLLVLVTYLWARHLAGRGAALAAGLLAAISPFAIYYSQEARAYVLVTLLAAASSLCLAVYCDTAGTRTARRPMGRRLLMVPSYVALASALIWSHYLGFLALLLQNLFVAAWLAPQRRTPALTRQVLTWIAMQAAVLLSYWPWLVVVFRQAGGWPAISQRQSLGFYLTDLVRLYTLGPASTAAAASGGGARIAWLALLPALCGLAIGWKRSKSPLLWGLVAAYAIWPALAMWGLSLLRGAYRSKFLLMGLPGFHVLAGAGAFWLGRSLAGPLGRALARKRSDAAGSVIAALVLLPLVAASNQGLLTYQGDQRFQRDDYRAVARYIEAATAAGGTVEASATVVADAIILDAPGQSEVFSYYYHGSAAVYALPRQRPPDEPALERELAALAARHSRFYALLWATDESDPRRSVETWLDLRGHKGIDAWYGNIRLVSYELPKTLGPAVSARSLATDARFGDNVRLLSYALSGQAVVPGQAVSVELDWLGLQPISGRYRVFLQALDAESNIVGQRDGEPVAGHRPTDTWKTGEAVVDRQAVPIFLGTPPGRYSLVAGLYDANTGVRLRLPDGNDHLLLGQVEVAPAANPVADEALRLASPRHIRLGPLRLLGWQCSRLGEQAGGRLTLAPGEALSLVLYWRVLAQGPLHLKVSLEGKGASRVLAEGEAMQGGLAPGLWLLDELMREPRTVLVPPDTEPGAYILTLQADSAQGSGRVDLAEVRVGASRR